MEEVKKAKQQDKLARDFSGYGKIMLQLPPDGWNLTTDFLSYAEKYRNFKMRENDVVVMSFPKCGSTWMSEVLWVMRFNPDLHFAKSQDPDILRVPLFELDFLIQKTGDLPPATNDSMMQLFQSWCPGKNVVDGMILQLMEAITSPRILKTHLTFPVLPHSILDTAKVVYMVRNPKDVIVSFHHHCRISRLARYVGSFENFVQYFLDDKVLFGPYWAHVQQVWDRRHHPNLLILYFEDLKADFMKELHKLNSFLGLNLSDGQLQRIQKYMSFDEMKAREDTRQTMNFYKTTVFDPEAYEHEGGFFRQGEVGSWRKQLSPELAAKVDKWTAENTKRLGITLKY